MCASRISRGSCPQAASPWGRSSSGGYEGTKPNDLCCSSFGKPIGANGSACLRGEERHTLLLCTAEEAFLAGGKQLRPTWVVGDASTVTSCFPSLLAVRFSVETSLLF